MWKLQLAELRGSWSAWLGVSLAFIVTNFALSLSALALFAGWRAMQTGKMDILDSTALVFIPGQNFFFSALVGAIVIGSATSMVLNARRGGLARLALGGATPRQIATTAILQLIAVSLVCSVIGSLLAILALKPALAFLAFERADAGSSIPSFVTIYSLWPILAATVIAVGVALIGGLRQVLASSKVAPVEALREHARDGQVIKMTKWRWAGVAIAVIAIVASYASIPSYTAEPNKETISNLLIASMTVLMFMAVLLSLLAPIMVRPITRFWCSLIPARSASWQLARRTVSARATRLTRSLVPVMLTIGLLIGTLSLGGSIQGILLANGFDIKLSASGDVTMLIILGLPLLVSLAGGVGSLIMMSRQRDAELALLGIVGATPSQRIVIPTLEAIIITITGLIMALVMVAISLGVLVIGIQMAGYKFALYPPLVMFTATLGVTLLTIIGATVVPTLRARKQAEPGVIARLVAD